MDLGQQVGPLPLGAWLAVVGVGGAIAYTARKDEAPYVGEVMEDISTDEGVGMGGGAVDWLPVAPITSDAPVGGAIETNEDWQRAATNWLISQKYEPSSSASAIAKYLNEERLSINGRALVNKALAEFGLPPNPPRGPFGGIPVPIPPKKKRKPRKPNPPRKRPKNKGDDKGDNKRGDGQKRAKIRYHTVRPGNTLSGIANRYYGNRQAYRRIFEANRKGKRRDDGTRGILTNPNLIFPGQKLIIP